MSPLLEVFRHLSRRHGLAVRHQANMAVRGSVDQRDDALDQVKDVEREAEMCLQLVRRPPSMGSAG
ncbi:MAG: hypothetical protein WDM91_11050 [Rhizomicrobium sp.]